MLRQSTIECGDFGCGAGHKLQVLQQMGFQAYGCDVSLREEPLTHELHASGIIRLIPLDQYHLPFDDSQFDAVISDQVFEHVQDYPTAIREIARVTKPAGIGLHIFPSRYKILPTPREPHVGVPFGTLIQSRWWTTLWAIAGLRGKRQKGM